MADVKDLAETAMNASVRSRQVTWLLIVAIVISFFASWNSRPHSWPDARYEIISKASEFCDRQLCDTLKKVSDTTTKVSAIDTVGVFLKTRHIKTLSELNDLKKIYNDLEKDAYTVKIPFFGVSFDINDLGIFSGIIFCTLLILLIFSMDRENNNINMTLIEAQKDKQLRFYYNYLSAGQVLTYPKKIYSLPESVSFRKYGKKYLIPFHIFRLIMDYVFLFPCLVQSFIVSIDLRTKYLWINIESTLTMRLLIYDIAFLILISIVSFFCLQVARESDRLWNHYYELAKLEPAETPNKEQAK